MKSLFSKIAVFAIMLFCSQMAFGQSGKVVCYENSYHSTDIWIDAPYFSCDLIAEIDDYYNDRAKAWVTWPWGWAVWECPSNCGFWNIGQAHAGGVNVNIGCETSGYWVYAVAEAWAEW